ncbi:hypothetical protein GS421_02310 [Rhodococcus hoagii]|nr:hypothetical protein [Prescottella equi]
MLRQLQPDWSITTFERLDAAAAESSDPWNNAGTGHSALCELNYTRPRATASTSARPSTSTSSSRSPGSSGVRGRQRDPHRSQGVHHPIPHVSFVHGADNVKYLRARYDALAGHPLSPVWSTRSRRSSSPSVCR